jgi:hypothetical protein
VLPGAKLESLGLRSRVKTTAFGPFLTLQDTAAKPAYRGKADIVYSPNEFWK